MKVTEKYINGKVVELAVIESDGSGCKKCMFQEKCTNPPVNRVMPCFSIDRKDRTSVYYQIFKK